MRIGRVSVAGPSMPLQPQQQLNLGVERPAVDHDRRSGQPPDHRAGQLEDRAGSDPASSGGELGHERHGGQGSASWFRSIRVHLGLSKYDMWTPMTWPSPTSRHRRHPTSSTSTRRSTRPRARLPHDRFLDRELSWLAFNARVLELAQDDDAAAARARPLPGDLREQPRRVLHGPRRGPQAPHRRRCRGAVGERAQPARRARAQPRATSQRAHGRARRRRSATRSCRRSPPKASSCSTGTTLRPDRAGADAARSTAIASSRS